MSNGSHPASLEPNKNVGGWRRRESNPRTVPIQGQLFHPDLPPGKGGVRSVESIKPCYANGGWLYLIQAATGGPIKIGKAVNPLARLQLLQTGHSEQLVLLSAAPAAGNLEKKIHSLLAHARLRGEWFEAGPVLKFFGINPSTAAMVRRAA